MIDPTDLVDGVLRGVLGGRRKRSGRALRYLTRRTGRGIMSNPNALLTVAGVAWGIFETLQNQGAAGAPGRMGAPGTMGAPGASGVPAAVPTPPLPNVSAEAATVPSDALRMVRLTIAAAAADGTFTDADQAAVLKQAKGTEAEHLVEMEIARPRPVAEIVAGVADPAQRAALYVLAFGIIRGDESVSGAERIFLAQLANQLRLDPDTVKKLEADASQRIDEQPS
jgi:uncharacterized membrane protein YebE (DUF533 family)